MSDKLRAAAKAALDWLESTKTQSMEEYLQVIDSLKAALAEPTVKESLIAQRPWVGLTDDEANEYNYLGPDMLWVVQEVEAKLREKNNEALAHGIGVEDE